MSEEHLAQKLCEWFWNDSSGRAWYDERDKDRWRVLANKVLTSGELEEFFCPGRLE